jgi:hypothetical protein
MKATDTVPAMAEVITARPMKDVAKLSALVGEAVPPTVPQLGAKARYVGVEWKVEPAIPATVMV